MTTKVINLKYYRQNITFLWKEAKNKNIRYIVMYHSSPILEVRPYMKEELVFYDAEQQNENNDYYKTLEQNLEFWNSEKDDDIFVS